MGWQGPAVFVLLLAGGMWLPLLMSRRGRLDSAESVVLSFGATVGVASIASTFGHYTRVGLVAVEVGLIGGVVASVVLFTLAVRRGTLPLERGGVWGLGTAGLAAVLTVYQGSGLVTTADSLYHAAAVRRLAATGAALVTDPYFGTSGAPVDPSTGSWHSLAAAASRLLGDPVTMWTGLMVLGVVVYVLGLWVVIRFVTRSPRFATVATVLALFVITSGGFLVWRGLPGFWAQSLVIVALTLLVRLVREPSWELGLGLVLVGCAASLAHLGGAQLLAVAWVSAVVSAAIGLAGAGSGDLLKRGRGLWWALGATAAVVATALPLTLARLSQLGGTVVTGGSPVTEWAPSILTWPAPGALIVDPADFPGLPLFVGLLAAAVVFILLARRRPGGAVTIGVSLALMTLLVGFDPALTPFLNGWSNYTLSRVVRSTTLPMWAGVSCAAFYLIRWWAESRRRPQGWRGWTLLVSSATALLALVLAAAIAVPGLATTWSQDETFGVAHARAFDLTTLWGPGSLLRVRRVLGPGWPTIIGAPYTQMDIAGVAPVDVVSVTEGHTPFYFITHGFAGRNRDSLAFMSPGTSEAERRVIASRYGVRFVVIEYPGTRFAMRPGHFEEFRTAAAEIIDETDTFQTVLDIPGEILVLRVLEPR